MRDTDEGRVEGIKQEPGSDTDRIQVVSVAPAMPLFQFEPFFAECVLAKNCALATHLPQDFWSSHITAHLLTLDAILAGVNSSDK